MLSIIITIVIIGVIMYLVNMYVPMAPMIKTILNWGVAILVVLWFLQVAGIYTFPGATLH